MSRPSALQQVRYFSRATIRFWWPLSPIILSLVAVNFVVFLVVAFLSDLQQDQILLRYALAPERLISQPAGDNQWAILFTFISHAFLHSDFFHLSLNMFWLFIFGQPLAVRFGAVKSRRPGAELTGIIVFLAFYLSAAVFAGLVFTLVNLDQPVLLIGASGAISAVTAGAIRVTLRRFQPFGLADGKPLPVLDWKILLVTVFYIASNLILLTPFGEQEMFGRDPAQIAWEAHIGGFLYGLVMFSFFDRLTTKR